MKSNYPDKYCSNCNKVTERYARGNCKECMRKRNITKSITQKKILEEQNKYVKKIRKETFNKESYTKFTIENLILDKNNGKQNYIYFLTKGDNLVYIGKSENNFLFRIGQHIKNKDFDDIYYKSFSMTGVVEEYEKNLIIKYRPKYNKMLAYSGAKVQILDTKTLEVFESSVDELVERTGCAISTAQNLVLGKRNKMYNRYILNENRTGIQVYKNILDTHTGNIERHSIATFAEKVGVSQNSLWHFFRGIAKSFRSKRYLLIEDDQG